MGLDGLTVEDWDLNSAAAAFGRWRRGRSRGTRIPEDLWGIAASLVADHGISKISQRLKLDYYALKKRVDGGARSRSSALEPFSRERPRFVEVSGAVLSSAPTLALEVESGIGTGDHLRMKIKLENAPLDQFAALVAQVWTSCR